MIRPLTLLSIIAAAGAGLHVYNTKHAVSLLDRELRTVAGEIQEAEARTTALRADWSWATEQERLRALAQRHLALEPMQPSQFVRFTEAERRLPPPAAPDGPAAPFAPHETTAAENGRTRIALLPPEGSPASRSASMTAASAPAPAAPPLSAPALAAVAQAALVAAAEAAAPSGAGRAGDQAREPRRLRSACRRPRSHALPSRGRPKRARRKPRPAALEVARATAAVPAPQPRPIAMAPRPVAPVRLAADSPSALAAAPVMRRAAARGRAGGGRFRGAGGPRAGSGGDVARLLRIDAGRRRRWRRHCSRQRARRAAAAGRLRLRRHSASMIHDSQLDELRPPPTPLTTPVGVAAGPARAPFTRIAAPELARRAQIERTRGRLVVAACGFAVLFGAVGLKLGLATVLDPAKPKLRAAPRVPTAETTAVIARADITDRNGETLAMSLPVTEFYANPQEINDPVAAADRLVAVLPDLDRERLVERLSQRNVPGTERPVQFAYIARNLTPRQRQAVNDLGIPGFHFRDAERRFHPQGTAAAHLLGSVDVDGRGIAGVERSFDERLQDEPRAAPPVHRRARAGGAARGGAEGDHRLHRHRRRRRGHRRQHRGSAGHGQPAGFRHLGPGEPHPPAAPSRPGREARPGPDLQPRHRRPLRAGLHLQAVHRGDRARQRRGEHLERLRRLPPDPLRPVPDRRLQGQEPLAGDPGDRRLLVQHRHRAHGRRGGHPAPPRLHGPLRDAERGPGWSCRRWRGPSRPTRSTGARSTP